MIVLYVRIDYYRQFRRVEPASEVKLRALLEKLALDYGARPMGRDHPFIALFDQTSLFWRIQAVEAVSQIRKALTESFDGILDPFVALHIAPDEESLLSGLDRAWTALETTAGIWLTPEAAEELSDYIALAPSPSGLFEAGEPIYHTTLPFMSAREFYKRDEWAANLSELIGDLVVGGEQNILIVQGAAGTGKEATVARALESLGYPAEEFLTLRGGSANPRPFDPLACGVTNELVESVRKELSSVELALYERLVPAYRFVFSSPYRTSLSPSMETGYRLFISLVLRAYARKMSNRGLPPLVLCENLHRFSPESLGLLGDILQSADIQLLATTAKGPPEAWPAYALIEWTPSSPSFEEFSRKLQTLLPESSEEERRALFSRARGDLPLLYRCALMARDRVEGPPPSEAILGRMPREAAAVLYAVSLCENVLETSRFHEFLERLGLYSQTRDLVLDLLRDTGYISGPGPRGTSRMSNRRLAGFVGKDTERIEEALAEYLSYLYRSRKLSPSLGLLNATRKSTDPDRPKFELDCALSDAVADPGDHPRLTNREATPAMRKLRDAEASILLGEKDRARSRLEELEDPAIHACLPTGITELFRAELAFGRRSYVDAARFAKDTLLNARGSLLPKAEARAHRLLGLCSLARERPREGIEYLGNAQEIAESAHDEYERLICQWYIAVNLFTIGCYDKALRQIADAEETARGVFRRDWEAACLFLRSRVFLELGHYEEARRGFQSIRAIARAYGFPEADTRAEIWDARAQVYLGSREGARALFARYPQDAEALFFGAELELLDGNPVRASELLLSIPPIPQGDFDPSEKIFWDSGYRNIERRAFGTSAAYPYDADLVKAYTLFAQGLELRDSEYASALYRMTREEKLAQDNPSFSLYLYFCFLLLERLPRPPLDKATVLSRAFKYLQERAGRIEDASGGSDFLEKNLWNQRLVEAARRFKLL